MPRAGESFTLAGSDGTDYNDAHQQLNSGAGNTEQTLNLDKDCNAVLLSARTANAYVTFNDTAAAAGNGIEIIAGAQPVLIPLGFHAGPRVAATGGSPLRMIGASANALLNVLQLN